MTFDFRFPFLFPHLPYVVYIDKHITFHDDVGHIYNEFLKFDEEEAIGMVQEQSLRYMRSFGTFHMKSPSTSLSRPPSKVVTKNIVYNSLPTNM